MKGRTAIVRTIVGESPGALLVERLLPNWYWKENARVLTLILSIRHGLRQMRNGVAEVGNKKVPALVSSGRSSHDERLSQMGHSNATLKKLSN